MRVLYVADAASVHTQRWAVAFRDLGAEVAVASFRPAVIEGVVVHRLPTAGLGRAMRLARRLEFGGVTINVPPTFRADQMPYGGTKESGNTKEGPRWAVRELTEERLVLLGGG